MTIKIGEKLPDATFMAMSSGAPAPMKTEDVFAGKKVAVFALPGAFTPTCSARHLPGFLAALGLEDSGDHDRLRTTTVALAGPCVEST